MSEAIKPLTEAELEVAADAVLNEHYANFGLNYCVALSDIDEKYLRKRVGVLNVRLNEAGLSYVNRTKHKDKPPRKYNKRRPALGMRAEDNPLSALEKLAMGIKSAS